MITKGNKLLLFIIGANLNAETSSGVTPMMLATKVRDYTIIKYLLSRGADINHVESVRQYTALSHALENNNEDAVMCLLAHGANPNPPIENIHATPLVVAVRKQKVKLVDTLLGLGCLANNKVGAMALSVAVMFKKKQIGELLIKHGAPCWPMQPTGITSLMKAVQKGNLHFVELILDSFQNLDINYCDNYGQTVLHYAVLHTQSPKIQRLFELFINRGCDYNKQDNQGMTPLMKICYYVRAEVIYNNFFPQYSERNYTGRYIVSHLGSYLLNKRNTKYTLMDNQGRSLLFHLINSGCICLVEDALAHVLEVTAPSDDPPSKEAFLHTCKEVFPDFDKCCDIFIQLLKDSCDPSEESCGGHYPVHLAVIRKTPLILLWVLSLGYNPNERSGSDKCQPVHLAAKWHDMMCLKVLIQHKAHIGEFSEDKTPLMLAVMCYFHYSSPCFTSRNQDSLECIKVLLQHGADPLQTNSSGLSSLHFAAMKKTTDLLATLYEHQLTKTKTSMEPPPKFSLIGCATFPATLSYLLKKGCCPNESNSCGISNLTLAMHRARDNMQDTDVFGCVQILIANGVHVQDNQEGANLMSLVASMDECNDQDFFLSKFLTMKSYPNCICSLQTYQPDMTPFLIALSHGRSKMVKFLIGINCDVTVPCEDNGIPIDPLSLAIQNCPQLVSLVIKAGAPLQILQRDFNVGIVEINKLTTVIEGLVDSQPQIYETIKRYVYHPLSLKELSRIAIRRMSGIYPMPKINVLPLPTIMKEYVLLIKRTFTEINVTVQ